MSPELKRFLSIAWHHKRRTLLGVFLSGLGVVPDVLTPILISILTAKLIAFGTHSDAHVLYFWTGMLVVNMLANSIIKYISILNENHLEHVISGEYIKRLTAHILNLPPAWFTSQKQGAIMSDVSRTIYGSHNLVSTLLCEHPGQIVVMLLSIGYCVAHYGMVALALIPLMAIAILLSYMWDIKYVATAVKRRGKATRDMDGDLSDPIQCHDIIRDYDAEDAESSRIAKVVDRWVTTCISCMRGWALGTAGSSMTNSILFGCAMFGGIVLFVSGRLGVADIVYINSLTLILKGYVNTIGDSLRSTNGSLTDLSLIEPIFQHTTEKGYPLYQLGNKIVFDRISFAYPKSESLVLDDVSFVVEQGEAVGFVGESGAGKTTLMRLLQGDYVPTRGYITIGSSVRRNMVKHGIFSHVQQDSIMFHRTVLDNIGYPASARSDHSFWEFAEDAAKRSGAHEFITKLDKGYATVVGDRGVTLSGGQRQRIAIARAFFNKRPIMILDEATANLDSVSEDIVKTSLENRPKGQTVFVIAHRLKTVRDLDKIIVMKGGRVLGIGKHDDLIKSTPYYRELCEKQNAI